jgi:hypothetical protein
MASPPIDMCGMKGECTYQTCDKICSIDHMKCRPGKTRKKCFPGCMFHSAYNTTSLAVITLIKTCIHTWLQARQTMKQERWRSNEWKQMFSDAFHLVNGEWWKSWNQKRTVNRMGASFDVVCNRLSAMLQLDYQEMKNGCKAFWICTIKRVHCAIHQYYFKHVKWEIF